jgi:DNA-directed RNA polymerase omega subunit
MFNTKLYAAAAEKITHKYLLTNMVSMRARQIEDGADPMVDPEDLTPIDIALKEIAEGLVTPKAVEEVTTADDLFG